MSEDQQLTGVQIVAAGKDADIPAEHRQALDAQEKKEGQQAGKPFENFTQREQIAILHAQIDGMRTGYALLTQSVIEQAGALRCAMSILKDLKPEWTIKPTPVEGGKAWVVVDNDGQVVESIFDKLAEESRPVQDNQPENATAPGDKSE